MKLCREPTSAGVVGLRGDLTRRAGPDEISRLRRGLRSRATPGFWKAYHALPAEIQERAKAAFSRFGEDPSHPGLQFKQVHLSEPIFSVRVSLGWRALAVQREDAWVWFWIGSHAQYDALLKRL